MEQAIDVRVEAVLIDRVGIHPERRAERHDRPVVEIDQRLSKQVDAILHHPQFQELEGAWRSLAYVVDNVDFRENLFDVGHHPGVERHVQRDDRLGVGRLQAAQVLGRRLTMITFPVRSMIVTVPASSPHSGCSMNAIRSSDGENRARLIQRGVQVRRPPGTGRRPPQQDDDRDLLNRSVTHILAVENTKLVLSVGGVLVLVSALARVADLPWRCVSAGPPGPDPRFERGLHRAEVVERDAYDELLLALVALAVFESDQTVIDQLELEAVAIADGFFAAG